MKRRLVVLTFFVFLMIGCQAAPLTEGGRVTLTDTTRETASRPLPKPAQDGEGAENEQEEPVWSKDRTLLLDLTGPDNPKSPVLVTVNPDGGYTIDTGVAHEPPEGPSPTLGTQTPILTYAGIGLGVLGLVGLFLSFKYPFIPKEAALAVAIAGGGFIAMPYLLEEYHAHIMIGVGITAALAVGIWIFKNYREDKALRETVEGIEKFKLTSPQEAQKLRQTLSEVQDKTTKKHISRVKGK